MEDKEQIRIETMAEEIEKRMEQAKNVVGSMNKGIGYWIAEDLVEKGYMKDYISEERAREIGKEMFSKVRKETANEILSVINIWASERRKLYLDLRNMNLEKNSANALFDLGEADGMIMLIEKLKEIGNNYGSKKYNERVF